MNNMAKFWYIMMKKDLKYGWERLVEKDEKGGCIGVELVKPKTCTKP
jgi:hypothetical protein